MSIVVTVERTPLAITVNVLRGTGVDLTDLTARLAAAEAAVAALEANQLPAGNEGDILIHSGGHWVGTDTLPIG